MLGYMVGWVVVKSVVVGMFGCVVVKRVVVGMLGCNLNCNLVDSLFPVGVLVGGTVVVVVGILRIVVIGMLGEYCRLK